MYKCVRRDTCFPARDVRRRVQVRGPTFNFQTNETMNILVAMLRPESLRGGCSNHPAKADMFRAMAVEDICDGRQKYVRRPSHEASVADREMG